MKIMFYERTDSCPVKLFDFVFVAIKRYHV